MRLRYLLAAAFTVVATVPVIFLGAWVQNSWFQKELAVVEEKHLLLADNITAALERYSGDSVAAMNHFIDMRAHWAPGDRPDFSPLAVQLGFRHFCILDRDGAVVEVVDFGIGPLGSMPKGMFAEIRDGLDDRVTFSRVVNDSEGNAVIYLSRRVSENRIALAALDTGYIVDLQRSVIFGRKGHAAIVDHQGNLIAHPKPDWTREHKNIAKVEPVRRMLQGQTGVTPFFSPAMKQDMISGYATVSGPGWGVMVPQPIVELEEQAEAVLFAALTVGLLGIAAAAAIGWFLAGTLSRPLQAILFAARRIASGQFDARVAPQTGPLPREVSEVAEGFNGMAETIQHDKARLETALEDARKADRAKSEFLAAMSHELRTPLNSIIGFAEVIRADAENRRSDSTHVEYATDIHTSGKQLLAIINDILDLSKIEAGLLTLTREPVDCGRNIQSAVRALGKWPEQAGITLDLEVTPELPLVWGDAVKLRQVLDNLLSNAIKFTPEGGRVTLSAHESADGTLAIRIEDTGIGMTGEEVEIALTPFRQVDGKLNRQYEGTGLGLPLAKRLVELHGGTLEIGSTPGAGTSVLVRLPADAAVARAA